MSLKRESSRLGCPSSPVSGDCFYQWLRFMYGASQLDIRFIQKCLMQIPEKRIKQIIVVTIICTEKFSFFFFFF